MDSLQELVPQAQRALDLALELVLELAVHQALVLGLARLPLAPQSPLSDPRELATQQALLAPRLRLLDHSPLRLWLPLRLHCLFESINEYGVSDSRMST